jgi:tRNA modification GTPase
MNNQAICAIATPPGTSALGIIRISGSNIKKLLSPIFSKRLKDRAAILTDIHDGSELIDNVISIYYASPRSYTGEDIIEIICHGNQIILNTIIQLLNKCGIRTAEPGEFTKRAFFNSKLSLVQAEAVADLISASNKKALTAANNSLSGKFLNEINSICEDILRIRSEVESIINFPEDDDVPILNQKKLLKNIVNILSNLESLINNSEQGMALNIRPSYAVIGKPNSGKSSFINNLLRTDASIVTSKKGTTRDSITYELTVDDMVINIIDTAGIHATDDEIEREGISRSLKSASSSDNIIYLIDDTVGLTLEDEVFIKDNNFSNYILVFNKIDLTKNSPKIVTGAPRSVYVSAKTGDGMNLIKEVIKDSYQCADTSENIFLARNRHLQHLRDGQACLFNSKRLINEGVFDMLAEDLRLAHLAISAIIGQNPTEDLLNEIFTSFCIGK